MTNFRFLIALTLAGAAVVGVLAAYTLNAQASVEIHQLGAPVEGRLIHDVFGNTVGFDAFPEVAASGPNGPVE